MEYVWCQLILTLTTGTSRSGIGDSPPSHKPPENHGCFLPRSPFEPDPDDTSAAFGKKRRLNGNEMLPGGGVETGLAGRLVAPRGACDVLVAAHGGGVGGVAEHPLGDAGRHVVEHHLRGAEQIPVCGMIEPEKVARLNERSRAETLQAQAFEGEVTTLLTVEAGLASRIAEVTCSRVLLPGVPPRY